MKLEGEELDIEKELDFIIGHLREAECNVEILPEEIKDQAMYAMAADLTYFISDVIVLAENLREKWKRENTITIPDKGEEA
jgi:hypothetical protein